MQWYLLIMLATGEFTYPNDSAYQEVYVPFMQPMQLMDNQLFCKYIRY